MIKIIKQQNQKAKQALACINSANPIEARKKKHGESNWLSVRGAMLNTSIAYRACSIDIIVKMFNANESLELTKYDTRAVWITLTNEENGSICFVVVVAHNELF